jgi:hypothetical protein
MSATLGSIKQIDLRKIWKHEASDFSTWLAKPENLELLSNEIGVNIKLIQTEAGVGRFSVDIFAEEETTGRKIIIENQLEQTDHDHLGKVITYASGHDAEIIIWIVKDVRDEHKQAVDWLNEHTDEKINFFAIKMELWQIDSSAPAPKFQIVSQPNDWTKTIKSATKSGELSDNALLQLDFIQKFIDYCKSNNSKLRLGKPQPSAPAYYSISIGSSKAWVAVKLNSNSGILKTDLYFTDKEIFNELYTSKKEEIDKAFGKELTWDEMENYKGAIFGDSREFDINDDSKWEEYFEWMRGNAEKLQDIFHKFNDK